MNNTFRTVTLLLIIACIAAIVASPALSLPSPDFYASFDGTLNATDALGRQIPPKVARGVKFVDGMSGKAVYVGGPSGSGSPCLQYPANDLFNSDSGTVMFWVQPHWDGEDMLDDDKGPFYRFFNAGPNLDLFMYHWLRCDLGAAPKQSLVYNDRPAWLKGDWWHVAFTWDRSGWNKLYVDGLPYSNGFQHVGPSIAKASLDLGRIDNFFVGSTPNDWWVSNAAFSDFRIYRTALDASDIDHFYRSAMPLDLTVERIFLRAGQPEHIAFDISPGGQMTRPPVDNPVTVPVKASLQVSLARNSDGQILFHRDYPGPISGRETITLPVSNLAEGVYRVVCRVLQAGKTYQTSFKVYAYRQQPAPAVSRNGIKLGEPVVTIDCSSGQTAVLSQGSTKIVNTPDLGAYREASSSRDSRFAYELDLSAIAKDGLASGQPMMLDVYWPDDKPRSMGLYLYRPSHSSEQRDRLEGGIQSGEEFTLSGRIQKTSYLIYPWFGKYLLEARTMIDGYPAALSKIVVRPVVGRLPKLAVASPRSGPTRSFGHLDEDQSFDVMLAYDMPQSCYLREIRDLEMLLDYMDYTGQNIMSYPFIRYGDVQYDLPGMTSGRSPYFNSFDGWRDLLLDMMAARGKKVIATINAYTVDESNKLPDRRDDLLAKCYYQIDRYGQPVKSRIGDWLGNPLNALYRCQFMRHIDEILRRFGRHPALAGIDLWDGDWQIRDLNAGYDDLTIETFVHDTGIAVPSTPGAPDRFEARYAYLTGPKRKEWLAWRALKNASLLRDVAAAIHYVNPALTLGVVEFYDENESLDLNALRKIPGLVFVPMRNSYHSRWQQHWNGSFTTADELLGDMNRQALFMSGSAGRVYSYAEYFESFTKSLDQDRYSAYFQNADVKPHGRYFLRELAQDVASVDPSVILIGAQPIGTSGRDDESREFAQAFLALPPGDYRNIDGLADPVRGRYIKTKDATFVYLQNLIDADVQVNLSTPTDVKAFDLSAFEPIARTGGLWRIALKPFQLRSFRLSAGATPALPNRVVAADSVRQSYAAQLALLQEQVGVLRSCGANTDPYDLELTKMKAAVRDQTYAEAHRIAFSKLFRLLPAQMDVASEGYLKRQKQMIAESHIAIKCGSDRFYLSQSGTLFFPDTAYTPGGFGFVGSHESAGHPTDNMVKGSDRDLFSTEAYNLQGYRFDIPNGVYTVRLSNRIGYQPDAKPGCVVMTLDIQGKRVWRDMDFFAALGQDASRTQMSEFKHVVVVDGSLNVQWQPVNGRLGWCNAIEVCPEQ